MKTDTTTKWSELLKEAVTQPGLISQAYKAFHRYSLGNQFAAMSECYSRELLVGPIDTYKGWLAKGRQVKKGERAIALCMPITCKKEKTNKTTGETKEERFAFFVWKNNWFVLSQTEGDTVPEYSLPPEWSKERALGTLEISEIPFDMPNGNAQGYAREKSVAVSPIAAHPTKTLFHELAHVVLGHTLEGVMSDGDERTPRNIQELEAEAVAMLLCATLELPGVEYSRGYIQSWYKGQEVPEKSAQRIFSAANKILKAGHEVEAKEA